MWLFRWLIPWRSKKSASKRENKSRNAQADENPFAYFKKPDRLHRPSDIMAGSDAVPRKKGVYAWYFKELPKKVPEGNYVRAGVWRLVYFGIAGLNPLSRSTLRKRVLGFHLKSTAQFSTFRLSLGSLLMYNELDIMPTPVGLRKSRDISFGKDGEAMITEWLEENARVAWLTDEAPWLIEETVIRENGHLLPLNIDENEANPFRHELRRLRRKSKDIAWSS